MRARSEKAPAATDRWNGARLRKDRTKREFALKKRFFEGPSQIARGSSSLRVPSGSIYRAAGGSGGFRIPIFPLKSLRLSNGGRILLIANRRRLRPTAICACSELIATINLSNQDLLAATANSNRILHLCRAADARRSVWRERMTHRALLAC